MAETSPQALIELDALLASSQKVHLIGIGGIGMAGLAILLLQRGHPVSGSELQPGPLTRDLASRGAVIFSGHDAAHLAPDTRFVIRSSAIPPDNLEWQRARDAQLPVYQRGQVLPRLLPPQGGIAVSGTHGKTTTATLMAWLLMSCGKRPGYCVGGESAQLGAVADLGNNALLVVEADESDGTVVNYHPHTGVITNIEFDHMEHFADASAFYQCFVQFSAQAERLVYCADDPRVAALGVAHAQALGYGFTASAELQAVDFQERPGACSFTLVQQGQSKIRIDLPVPGRHNVLNALAAWGVGQQWGCPVEGMKAALESFQAPRRRFETVAQARGVTVINDYAHHPTEIRTVVSSAVTLNPKRILAVYQPHRYTRTLALGRDFPPSFEQVDEVVLTPVYAASESPLPGGTSQDLLEQFGPSTPFAVRLEDSLEKAWQYLQTRLRSGDVLLVIGAGDVEKIAYWAKDYLTRDE